MSSGNKTENDTVRDERRKRIDKFAFEVVLIIISAAIGGLFTYFFTAQSEEDRYVKVMAERFEYVQENMSMDKAIDSLTEQIDDLENEVTKSKEDGNKEKEALEDKMKGMIEATVKSPKLVVDQLEKKLDGNASANTLIIYGENLYYSENLINSLLKGGFKYGSDDDTIFYSSEGQSEAKETKVLLSDTSVLYDGEGLEVYKPSDGKELKVGGKKYTEGFALVDVDWGGNYILGIGTELTEDLIDSDTKRYGDMIGYALLDLGGEYSELSFDIGREVTQGTDSDATLKVYLDGKLAEEDYPLSGSESIKSVTIPLNHAKTMKIVLTDGNCVRYVFLNATLTR